MRVAIATLAPLVSRGLLAVLREEHGISVVAYGLRDHEIERAVAEHAVDVLLLSGTTITGFPLLRRLTERSPDLGIVVLHQDPTREYGLQLLIAGASAVLGFATSESDLITAVRLAAAGKHMLTCEPALPSAAVAYVSPSVPLNLLTRRERQVLDGLRHSRSNSEIATDLSVEVETVRTHVKRIFRKLGVSNRRELVNIDVSPPHHPFVTRS